MPVNNIIEGSASGVVLDVDTTVVGNVGGGEDDLIVSTIPANTLDIDHKYIHFSASGQFATSVNSKQLRAYFGSTKIFDSGSLAITSVSDWILEGWVIRISATTEHALVKFECSSNVLSAYATYSTPNEDLTNQVILKCTGAGTSDNDITQTDLIVDVNNGGTGLGDVSGPSSSIDGHFASFNGTTGKVIKDGTQPTTLANDLLWSAKGQLAVGVGSATGTVLSLGTNGQQLAVATGSVSGLQWITPASGGGNAIIATNYPSGTSTSTFSSIPSTYNHLYIVLVGRSTKAATNEDLLMEFNADTTASNYRYILGQYYGGNGAQTIGGDDRVIGALTGANSPSNAVGIGIIDIPFYAGAVFNKQASSRFAIHMDTNSLLEIIKFQGLTWKNTAAINRIDFKLGSGNFLNGTTIMLYGVT